MSKSKSELTGRLGVVGKREYVLVDVEYVFAKDLLRADKFDAVQGTGYQRELNEEKGNALAKAMRDGHYTPAGFAASISDKHKVIRHNDGTASIQGVSKDNPLAQTDGQHRTYAIGRLFAEDPDTWANTTIPLLISLDHSRLSEDFLNLQRGNAVSRNLMRSIEVRSGLIDDPEKLELITMATEVIGKLAANKNSFMHASVAYTANDKRKLQYSTLISSGSSTLATTIYGGAVVAKEFGKSADWLYNVYMKGWEYLTKHLSPLDDTMGDESSRKALFTGKLLEPLSLNGGNRGGTHLLLGVLTTLAWKTGYSSLETPDDADLDHMTKCVDWLWAEKEFDGGSAPSLRKHVGDFAEAFFKGFKGPKTDNIPDAIVEVLSPSTFGLNAKDWRQGHKALAKPTKPKTPKAIGTGTGKRGRPKGSKNKPKEAYVLEDGTAKKSPLLEAREAAAARTATQAAKV